MGAYVVHYFIAIHLPKELQSFYFDWQEQLKETFVYKKWTHPEDLHITLKFLGEVNEKRLKLLQEKLGMIEKQNAFDIDLGSLGTFGKQHQPRVLWIDVAASKSLMNIQEIIEEAAAQAGFPPENRPYRPHITLGKKWASNGILPESFFNELPQKFKIKKQFEVSTITLFRIHPGRMPSYEPVVEYSLLKNGREVGF